MPTVEGFFFGRLIEYDAGLHQSTSRPWYLMTQLNVVAEKVASRKISVEAARRTCPFRKLVRDVPDNDFWRTSVRRFLR